MSKLDIIGTILHNRFQVQNQKNLVEEDLDHRQKKFDISYPIISKNTIRHVLYRYDDTTFPFFSKISGLNEMCDYVLFAEEGKNLYVFVIEMKKGGGSVHKQLDAAKEFVNFIIASAKRIGNELDDYIYIKLIRISDSRINKFKKRVQKEENAIEYIDDYCNYPYKSFYLERMMQY